MIDVDPAIADLEGQDPVKELIDLAKPIVDCMNPIVAKLQELYGEQTGAREVMGHLFAICASGFLSVAATRVRKEDQPVVLADASNHMTMFFVESRKGRSLADIMGVPPGDEP